MPIHCFIIRPCSPNDPRAAGLLVDAHALGLMHLTQLECHDLYFVEGDLSDQDLSRLAAELLCDPITQVWRLRDESVPANLIERVLRPGVTDPVAEQIVRGAHELGIPNVERAATGQRFIAHATRELDSADLHYLARALLVNPIIHHYALGTIQASFPQDAHASNQVEFLLVCSASDDALLALSRDRRAALDLNEMRAIQNYFRSVKREPTDVEFEMIAQTWSEHCGHKTFKAKVSIQSSVASSQSEPFSEIDGILKTFIRAATEKIAAPWVRSAFVDNAGIIDFDDEFEVSFKVETHNHPSAIEPFGGANTGTGGVIRDVLGVSAKPIAATDVLCFGPQNLDLAKLPEGVLHPRRIRSGVVAGVQDYGNKIGIPTVSGAILYDEGFTANPLVFCGCVGIAPKNSHPRTPQAGDCVIVLGGKTGRDGLRGATFSSMTMDAQTGEVAGASVQIGDPITEKGLIEVIVRARDAKIYNAITDCGAGGLSSAVGEMAKDGGADVDLVNVRLKYPGLAPWEIWLSEAQERMVVAVPESCKSDLQKLCDIFDVELTDIGAFTDTGHLIVRFNERIVVDLANEFLHDGMPRRQLTADCRPPIHASRVTHHVPDIRSKLLELLSHPNIASKADVIRIYDHEVLGGTVVKPLTGAMNDGPSDACVIKPIGTKGTRGIVLSCGINAEYGKLDPYRMAVSVVDEAIRNAVAVGADPDRIALLDNFCWGDPLRPETLGGLIEAARGCYDAALHYRAPFISGKDSLNNEYLGSDGLRHAIPPTLLISAISIIDDVNQVVTMDLKGIGDVVYLLGLNSEQSTVNSAVPEMPEHAPELYRALHRAMQSGLVRACHDLSEGGLAVAAAEMCIGGRLGMELNVNDEMLFVETNGSLLVEVQPENCAKFESYLQYLQSQVRQIGQVTNDNRLTIGTSQIPIAVDELVAAWNRSA
ncbi:MAG: phosphoribosylformylglycinamidine synthase subunit PurL [Chloroflexi bacterium]|nr:phosphoribosylformylglycinamidine synthase subunit PurL [Chloroflexota bacterium]